MMKKVDADVIENLSLNVEEELRNSLKTLLGMYRYDEYIYPSVIMRELRISKDKANEILDMLIQKGVVEKCFQYYCPSCNHTMGQFLTEDVEAYCEYCDTELSHNHVNYAYHILPQKY